MKEKIAIIGANSSILPLIIKAKEMGYETHVFAWKSGAPGEEAADFFYPISISEKEKILEVCKQISLCGVVSITSDFAVTTVNYVARSLGLVGNSEKTDNSARNKYKMRCAFKAAGLYTPRFYEAGESFEITDISNWAYPVIVKPTDRWSSKGITRVDFPGELMSAVQYAKNESLSNKAIIEEYMDGPEYSAECISYKGEHRVLAFTQKHTTGYPHYIETGHVQPSDIPVTSQKAFNRTIYKALDALDIKNGASHVEFKILSSGEIGIIEIGARMGGDCIGTDLTPISTGMDYIRMVIDVACGKKPCFNIVTEPSPVSIQFIMQESDLHAYFMMLKNYPEKIVRAGDFNSDFNVQVIDSSTRHGYYIIKDL